MDFSSEFEALTGASPFPWQRALFEEFLAGRFPPACDIPTGLGKTAAMAIWLLALARRTQTASTGDFPRRLVYVVNRRTVVDQATREAEAIRLALVSSDQLVHVCESLRSLAVDTAGVPFAVSTLRGQFADNAEWRHDPARAALVIGTVDMVGSRLLFSGYGCGFKSRPLHAGFLGQDVLLIHDEAHLEPAFQTLVESLADHVRREGFRRFRVMALTATARASGHAADVCLRLTKDDLRNRIVKKRVTARKGLAFHAVPDGRAIADKVAELALLHQDSGQRILVFLRSLDDVDRVAVRLQTATAVGQVQLLTGTLRGLERDALAKSDPVFGRFMPKAEATARPGTVFLICTSAGEVGVNISADHMVCDLTPFDSMVQRLGRVNRFGESNAHIDVVSADEAPGPSEPYSDRCRLTRRLLLDLKVRKDGLRDASPSALNALPVARRQAAFAPPPIVRPVTDILFDAWALTSVRQTLPGRPAVADWLHGVTGWEPPSTYVAWREEVDIVTGDLLATHRPDELLDDFPVKPHELIRDSTWRVFKQFEMLAEQSPNAPVWVIDGDGSVTVGGLGELVANLPASRLFDSTVLLAPSAGGLDQGRLSGRAGLVAEGVAYDVADDCVDEHGRPRRRRLWDGAAPPKGMRLVRSVEEDFSDQGANEEALPSRLRSWRWYVRPDSADDDGSRTARQSQNLADHCRSAESYAEVLTERLNLAEREATAVKLAAGLHDLGKNREVWQRSVGNMRYPDVVLAKSGASLRPLELSGYRHELGSLTDVQSDAEFLAQAPEVQELVSHLIAAHHGRARPHFTRDESFDPERPDAVTGLLTDDTPARFGRLQRIYGRWGLAYLESLVRAADILASRDSPLGSVPPGASEQEVPR
jgi:CRISPR-associated endonuclease/helicase Cas3